MGIDSERTEKKESNSFPLLSLNHVSYLCTSLQESIRFYVDVLGFMLIQRPSSFNFKGAWLFNHGIGIHLLECSSPSQVPEKKVLINPKDNHISFQCSDMKLLMRRLEEMNVKYVKALVEEGGIQVEQIFFHDPDGYMIEICNCENIPVVPLSSSCPIKKQNPRTEKTSTAYCAEEVEISLTTENFVKDMKSIFSI